MAMTPLKDNVGIAIDGGGIKGLIIARALAALENELGCDRLLDHPGVRILAGTSTGSIISAAIAMGMKADAIAEVYRTVGQEVFPRIGKLGEVLRIIFGRSVYKNDKLIKVLKKVIREQTGSEDWTLGDVQNHIGQDKTLIITVVDITQRRTHFLKSYDEEDQKWRLWEAILASSSAPPALPVFTRKNAAGKIVCYTDGGVGSYGNPAYVVAREAVDFQGIAPAKFSLLSFGTGWQNADNYEKDNRPPSTWRGVQWAMNGAFIVAADAIRCQSLDILNNSRTSAMDFRRFQLELEHDIPAESYGDDATYELMNKLGLDLGRRIADNHFASPGCPPKYDPEGLFPNYTTFINKAKKISRLKSKAITKAIAKFKAARRKGGKPKAKR